MMPSEPNRYVVPSSRPSNEREASDAPAERQCGGAPAVDLDCRRVLGTLSSLRMLLGILECRYEKRR